MFEEDVRRTTKHNTQQNTVSEHLITGNTTAVTLLSHQPGCVARASQQWWGERYITSADALCPPALRLLKRRATSTRQVNLCI